MSGFYSTRKPLSDNQGNATEENSSAIKLVQTRPFMNEFWEQQMLTVSLVSCSAAVA